MSNNNNSFSPGQILGEMSTTVSPQQNKSCFLRSFSNKRYANKRRADPDMRLEAVLGSACKRMRWELQDEGVEVTEDLKSLPCDVQSIADASTALAAVYTGDYLEELKPFNSLEDLPQLSNYENTLSAKDGKNNEKFPLNDAEQIAAFFELVASDQETAKRHVDEASDSRQTDRSEKPISDQEVVDILLSCEVEQFSSQFDSLYNRVLCNLSSVEQPSCPCNSLEETTCFKCKRKDFGMDFGSKELVANLTGSA